MRPRPGPTRRLRVGRFAARPIPLGETSSILSISSGCSCPRPTMNKTAIILRTLCREEGIVSEAAVGWAWDAELLGILSDWWDARVGVASGRVEG